MRRRWPLVVVLLLMVLVTLAFRAWTGGEDALPKLIGAMRTIASRPEARAIFLVLYVVGPMAFVPGIAFNMLAGVIWPLPEAMALSYGAALVACAAHFAMGRLVSRQEVRDFLVHRGLAGVVQELETAGWLSVLLIRQFPLPFFGVNLAAGTSPVRFTHFMLGSGVGVLPNVIIYTVLAGALVEGATGARVRALAMALTAGAVMVTLGVVSRVVLRARRQRDA